MGQSRTVLVTGATGKVGRNLVAGLLAAGVSVRALVRSPAGAMLPPEVALIRGDLTDPSSVASAATGADAAFLLWPSFDPSGAAEAVDALARHVQHLVYLSAGTVVDGRQSVTEGVWSAVEALIEGSGIEWTFLRAGGFAGNALGWAEQVRSGSDRVRLPYPQASRSLIHEADIADAAVAVLLQPGHAGRAYVLTGPQTLTQAQQVQAIGEAVGIPLEFQEQSRRQAREDLIAAGFGPGAADHSLDYWASLVETPEQTSDGIQQITGHPARSFRHWAQDHVQDFMPLSTAEIGERYLDAFRTGRIHDALRLLTPDIVRVAPAETNGEPVPVQGVAEIMENSRQLNTDIQIRRVDIAGPLVADKQFAARFTFDQVHTPTGERRSVSKMSLYTVRNGRICREEVYYFESA